MQITPQDRKIIRHLKVKGKITVREAMLTYNILSLTKRISELNRKGYKLNSCTKTDKLRRTNYKEYYVIDRDNFAPEASEEVVEEERVVA
tara:strand:+ start:188 stop:457 length:270 start_codon:yes stop_codon:yes gene_type:complete